MPVTKNSDAGYADFLDATGDFESESQCRSQYSNTRSLPGNESEDDTSPAPANRGAERHKMTVSRTNRQVRLSERSHHTPPSPSTSKRGKHSDLCGYRPRMPGEDWEHYCKRSLRKFGKTLLKEATDVELEAFRLAMDKAEYAHLILALDMTDYEVQPEERAGNWVLSNTDLGNWGLKCVKREPACRRCIEADVDCTYTNSQHLSDGDCRLCSVAFAHCEGTTARKRVRQSNVSVNSIHAQNLPSKRARTGTGPNSGPSRQDREVLSTPRFTQNLWNTNGALGKEVMALRLRLEAQSKTQQALERDKSALEREVLTLHDKVVRLEADSRADRRALRAVRMALAERARAGGTD